MKKLAMPLHPEKKKKKRSFWWARPQRNRW